MRYNKIIDKKIKYQYREFPRYFAQKQGGRNTDPALPLWTQRAREHRRHTLKTESLFTVTDDKKEDARPRTRPARERENAEPHNTMKDYYFLRSSASAVAAERIEASHPCADLHAHSALLLKLMGKETRGVGRLYYALGEGLGVARLGGLAFLRYTRLSALKYFLSFVLSHSIRR